MSHPNNSTVMVSSFEKEKCWCFFLSFFVCDMLHTIPRCTINFVYYADVWVCAVPCLLVWPVYSRSGNTAPTLQSPLGALYDFTGYTLCKHRRGEAAGNARCGAHISPSVTKWHFEKNDGRQKLLNEEIISQIVVVKWSRKSEKRYKVSSWRILFVLQLVAAE